MTKRPRTSLKSRKRFRQLLRIILAKARGVVSDQVWNDALLKMNTNERRWIKENLSLL